MKHFKLACISFFYALSASTAMAGGLLTNTNQNIAFLRNPARDGAIGIDGVYSNPAGVAFLGKGLHLSFNIQNVYQTRIIESGMTVPALKGTPFYQPFKLNGGNENGIKEFKGKAAVPILPSFQAALNYENWGFQVSFALNGGGGRSTFNNGLGSFERQIAMIPALLYSNNLGSKTPGYSVNSYISGQQYVYGVQFGSTYRFNDHLAVYAGARFNYIWNKYDGNITNISANINGAEENLYGFFGDKEETLKSMAFYYKMRATEMMTPQEKTKYEAMSKQFAEKAEQMNQTKQQFADKYLDCTQKGWGITPIIGIDYKYGNLNVATRLEFTTHLNIENHTKRDDTGMFQDGVNTPNDLPGLLSLGAQYSILPNLRVMGSWHYFFDKDAKMANNKQKELTANTQEFIGGAEWDITKDILVSAGIQRTKYGLGKGAYLNDMSFVTSSCSYGFGAKFGVTKNMKINVAYFWTNYQHLKKEYDQPLAAAGKTIIAKNTDDFTRTNKVIGVGVDLTF